MQEAVRSVACLRSPKVRPDTGMHLGQLRLGVLQQIGRACCRLAFALFVGHLLHLFEAVYHSSYLTVTVVLENVSLPKDRSAEFKLVFTSLLT